MIVNNEGIWHNPRSQSPMPRPRRPHETTRTPARFSVWPGRSLQMSPASRQFSMWRHIVVCCCNTLLEYLLHNNPNISFWRSQWMWFLHIDFLSGSKDHHPLISQLFHPCRRHSQQCKYIFDLNFAPAGRLWLATTWKRPILNVKCSSVIRIKPVWHSSVSVDLGCFNTKYVRVAYAWRFSEHFMHRLKSFTWPWRFLTSHYARCVDAIRGLNQFTRFRTATSINLYQSQLDPLIFPKSPKRLEILKIVNVHDNYVFISQTKD